MRNGKVVGPRAAMTTEVVFSMSMKSCVLLSLLLFSTLSLADGGYLLSAEEWSRPRSGESLRELPALKAAIGDYTRQPRSNIIVRYPGGEEGVIWVQELRSWLIALGVPSRRIVVLAGSGQHDALDLRVAPAQ
ncbi:MAG: hypothetical protein DWQ09_05595 [Proteobacteria bacterium]|nr:MAG: hypothetical protein DWQ09_05595 [Pseudomonadota bacterium]QKK11420.1 MAG: hypothetical protein HND59_07285 [Pseudomonadota bacterium]